METDPVARGGGFGWWWLWLLIIIAIIWFAGWGWGGYGGWWWGRPATTAVAPATGTANGGNGNAATRTAAVVPSGEGVGILNAVNKGQFAGQRVDIRDVRVDSKVNERALWIGNTNGNNGGANGAGTSGAAANGATATGSAGTSPTAAGAEIPTLVVLTGAANAKNGGGNQAGTKGGNEKANNTVNGSLQNINNGELITVSGTVEKAPSAAAAKREFGISQDAANRLEKQGAYIRATQIMTAGGQQQ